jgi:feruloyl-CoA synthase
VAAMAWVNQAEARRLTGAAEDVRPDDPELREHLAAALRSLNAHAGSAARVERLLLLERPPSLDAGEITDKGYLNQRRTLECRAAEVARLYAEPVPSAVITP